MTTSKQPRRRLGRGLDSLVSAPVNIDLSQSPQPEGGSLVSLDPTTIRPNPRQPRQHFDEQALDSLAESIKTAGLMQPIVVRPDPSGGYQLIAGERRWRAATRLGLQHIPAIVRQIDDREAAEFALIENLQREDLNPIERADAFARLAHEYGMTHQQVADRVGLERSNITNHLRLLELDEDAKEALRTRRMSMGQARALLAVTNIEDRKALAREVLATGMSVRDVEKRARRMVNGAKETSTLSGTAPDAAKLNTQNLQERLCQHLGTKVEIRQGRTRGSGQLIVHFYSFDEFEGLLQRVGFDTARH